MQNFLRIFLPIRLKQMAGYAIAVFMFSSHLISAQEKITQRNSVVHKRIIPIRQQCLTSERLQNHSAGKQIAIPGSQRVMSPSFIWPIEFDIDDGVSIANYVDEDPTPGILDYEGGPIAYDGHSGTDIGLYDFYSMDRGVKVYAATGGVVIETAWDKFDRRLGQPWPDDGNYVFLLHDDGTISYYFHLRKNSITVNVGDTVSPGQMLGLVGSSGRSTGPHLHFEAGHLSNNQYIVDDPWHGTNQPLPTLWQNQKPYLTNYPFKGLELYVFTEPAAGGNIFNIPNEIWANRIHSPVVFGATEPYIGVYVRMRCAAQDSFTVQLLRPDNSIFATYTWAPPVFYTFATFYFVWNINGYVSPSDYGIWKARFLHAGAVAFQRTFQMGGTSVYGPRFLPIDGRSFRLDGTTQRDTLRRSSFSGPVTYSLLNPPPFVSLADSIVTIGGTSTQLSRSSYFQALATDGTGRRDTMWYHVVDTTKPPDPHTVQVIRASLKVLLEGPYNSGTAMMNNTLRTNGTLTAHFQGINIPASAVDSITVEIRNTVSNPSLRKLKPAWLLVDGTIKGFTDTTENYVDFEVPPGNYYLVVRHRNHLPVMSALNQALSGGVPTMYDFTTSQTRGYGTNPMKQVGSRFTMIAGDANSSGIISTTDANLVFGSLSAVGYYQNDINLNGVVNAADANIIFSNLNRTSQVP